MTILQVSLFRPGPPQDRTHVAHWVVLSSLGVPPEVAGCSAMTIYSHFRLWRVSQK